MALTLTRNQKIGGGVGAGVLATAALTVFMLSGLPSAQSLIDATPAGGILKLDQDYACNCVINKSITIDGQGVAKILSPNAAPALDIPSQPARVENVTVKNLEISTVSAAQLIYDIVRIGAWQTTNADELPRNITFDNVYVHGQPTQDVQRGIAANGVNVTVRYSRITEIHGRGMETQGIAAWNTPGPLNIHNNYIVSATEGIMIGGADARILNVIPTGITITKNYIFKPLSWHERDPSYAGIDWAIKNLLEIKNGKKVLIDGNILENCWGDAQIGFGMLLTTRNQDGGNPWNRVEDVTVTNNSIINVAGGFQVIGKDSPNASEQGSLIRIANNFISLAPNLGGNGRLIQIERTKDVTFENNEANPFHTILVMADTPVHTGLVIRNNLLTLGEYGILHEAGTSAKAALDKFAPGYNFTDNVIVTSAGSNVTSAYPAGNTFVPSKPATLPPGIGVDYAALKAAQAGVGPNPSPSPSPSATATVTISPSPISSPSPAPTAGESTDGTKGPSITDSSGNKWTLGGTRETLRNNQHMADGRGLQYKWQSKIVYVQGTDAQSNWYRWTGNSWVFVGPEPMPSASPTPTATGTPTPVPLPSPSPTATGTPKPSPSPSPVLPNCAPNQIIGNPAKCICLTGVRCTGSNARCL